MKTFIYGVPGVGKTHYSRMLEKRSGTPIIEADRLRKQAQAGKSRKDNPFLYLGTCLAYQEFGSLDEANAIKGLLAVREALSEVVGRAISEHDNVIIEGAFLDPHLLQKHGRVILLTTSDYGRHKNQFLKHAEKVLDFRSEEWKAARLIQEYMIREARTLNVKISENTPDLILA